MQRVLCPTVFHPLRSFMPAIERLGPEGAVSGSAQQRESGHVLPLSIEPAAQRMGCATLTRQLHAVRWFHLFGGLHHAEETFLFAGLSSYSRSATGKNGSFDKH